MKQAHAGSSASPARGKIGDNSGLAKAGWFVIDHFLSPVAVQRAIGDAEATTRDGQSARVRRGVAFARRNLLELEFVREIISDPGVQRVIADIAPGSVAVRAILFDKTGEANWTVPWHQDRSIAVRARIDARGFGPWSVKSGIPHVQPPLDVLRQMLTLRFHLDPCGPDNGPLRVIPGTHKYILDQHQIEACVETRAQIPCTTGAGGLLIMRPLLLHASSPAKTGLHRRVIHVEFGPPRLPGGVEWAMAG
jgi:hypothetical protein